MTDARPLLELDTLVTRPSIMIDGARHAILSPSELPVLVSHKLARQGRRIEELMQADALDEESQAELRMLVNAVSDTIMEPIAETVRAGLSDAHRMRVVEAFTMLLLSTRLETAAAILTGRPSTGENSSPASSASTAASRRGGWLRRLLRW